ncbi:hypothetical protein F4780DRAFT_774979 [Xylariomycetidae sp. FL0641]|nr:hypothetical protein F4780DRAFT_774979 [Xylariomycetidae sp. FL0641]
MPDAVIDIGMPEKPNPYFPDHSLGSAASTKVGDDSEAAQPKYSVDLGPRRPQPSTTAPAAAEPQATASPVAGKGRDGKCVRVLDAVGAVLYALAGAGGCLCVALLLVMLVFGAILLGELWFDKLALPCTIDGAQRHCAFALTWGPPLE